MARVRLDPMTPAALDAWRRERAVTGPLPEASPAQRQEPLVILLDGEPVGRVLLAAAEGDEAPGWSVRAIDTSLHSDDTEEWAEVLTAIADHALAHGAAVVDTTVPRRLAPVFEAAGYRTTGTVHAKRLALHDGHFQDDRRVAVRPMDAAERAQFAAEARELVRAGVLRDGPATLPGGGVPLADRIDRIDRIDSIDRIDRSDEAGADDTGGPDRELLLTATVDGTPVGRVWATLVREDGGALDVVGHVLEIFPEHRGLRLTPSLLGALARHVRDLGVRDVHLQIHGPDDRARARLERAGLDVADVHLRRDLG
jgi:GNAT superfamily N-acetyltransferase